MFIELNKKSNNFPLWFSYDTQRSAAKSSKRVLSHNIIIYKSLTSKGMFTMRIFNSGLSAEPTYSTLNCGYCMYTHCKHEMFTKFWCNAGPTSATLGHHHISIWWTSHVYSVYSMYWPSILLCVLVDGVCLGVCRGVDGVPGSDFSGLLLSSSLSSL